MINLVIADDHPVVREGLRAMFEAESDVKVVREISQGSEIFDVATQLWPKFNVLVLDARQILTPLSLFEISVNSITLSRS